MLNTAESWAVRYIDPVLAGDVDSAFHLVCALGNDKRGVFADALWQYRIPQPAFQKFLEDVWNHDHRYLIDAAKNRRRLRAMFNYAAFSLPAHLPETVTVWRGTSALPFKQAVRGLSWTVDRDCACWFAMRFAGKNGNPLVLKASVPKSNILMFTDSRSEREAVIFDKKPCLDPAGVTDWQQRYVLHEQKLRQDSIAMLAAAQPDQDATP